MITDKYGNTVEKVLSTTKVTQQFPKSCSLFKLDVYSSGYRVIA